MCRVKWIESRIQIEIIKYREAENTNLLSLSSVKQVQQVIALRSQNIFFCMKSKNTVVTSNYRKGIFEFTFQIS